MVDDQLRTRMPGDEATRWWFTRRDITVAGRPEHVSPDWMWEQGLYQLVYELAQQDTLE